MMAAQDSFFYERFKFNLAKSAAARSIAGIISSDPEKETSFSDRLYQLYGLAFALAWVAVMWVFLISFVEEIFSALGPALTLSITQLALLLPAVLFVVATFRFARSSPWKMSHPDISFIASSPIKTVRIILWEMLKQVVPLGVMGFIVGFLLGVGFSSGSAAAANPFMFALAEFVFVSCAIVCAWIVGIVRLTLRSKKDRMFLVIVCGVLVVLLVAIFLLVVSNINFVNAALLPITLCLSAGIICLGIVVVVKLSSKIDVTKAIADNSFYADMHRIRKMPLYDASGYSEIKRRKRVANRSPIVHLPIGNGVGALLSRSLMSHIRQFEGLPHIMIWGMIAAPTVVVLLLTQQSPVLWLICIQILLLMTKGVREITRVFRDDMNNRQVSDHLPFSVPKLFLYDSILGTILCLLVSIPITALIFGSSELLPLALVLCLLANCTFVLCAGIDGLPLFSTRKSASYEIFVVLFVVGALAVSSFNMPLLLVLFIFLYGASMMVLMKCS